MSRSLGPMTGEDAQGLQLDVVLSVPEMKSGASNWQSQPSKRKKWYVRELRIGLCLCKRSSPERQRSTCDVTIHINFFSDNRDTSTASSSSRQVDSNS